MNNQFGPGASWLTSASEFTTMQAHEERAATGR